MLRRRPVLGALALAVLAVPLALPVAVPASAAGDRVEKVRVVVDLAAPSDASTEGVGRRAAAQRRVAAAAHGVGGQVARTYRNVPAITLEVPSGALQRLRRHPDVRALVPDERMAASLATSVPHVGAPAVWERGVDAADRVVAVLDTGVEASHPFLAGRVVHEACFTSEGGCPDGTDAQVGAGAGAPCRYDATVCPHGTHVTGIVAGSGATSAGVARAARVAAVQVFSRTSDGCEATTVCATSWTSDIVAGLDHVLSLTEKLPVAAVNLSVGGGSYSGACDGAQPSLHRAVAALRSRGVVTVVAAGNDGRTGAMSAPACLSNVVAVGSTSRSDVVSAFSNSSDEIDVLAPGEAISSSWTGGRTARGSGTSQATPHVAGAVALLRSAVPSASADEVVDALRSSGPLVVDARTGRATRRLQVDAALAVLEAAVAPVSGPATAPAPEPVAVPVAEPVAAPVAAPVATRLSGADRYDTAAAVFSRGFSCAAGGADTAVVAVGTAFADALSGSHLAGVHRTGVLLTAPDVVPAATLDALRSAGVRRVLVLGGTSAVPASVVQQLSTTASVSCSGEPGAPLAVERVSGADRFATARAVAERSGAAAVGATDLDGTATARRTAVLASGTAFADALAAGPLAYAGDVGGPGFPLLLTPVDALAPDAEAALVSLGVEQVIVAGGPSAVGPAVEDRLRELGLAVVRVAGADRVATAVALARLAVGAHPDHVSDLGFAADQVVLARGDGFADALAGTALAGRARMPLLLTASPTAVGDATASFLADSRVATRAITVLGGVGAVGDVVVDDALRRLTALP